MSAAAASDTMSSKKRRRVSFHENDFTHVFVYEPEYSRISKRGRDLTYPAPRRLGDEVSRLTGRMPRPAVVRRKKRL